MSNKQKYVPYFTKKLGYDMYYIHSAKENNAQYVLQSLSFFLLLTATTFPDPPLRET